MDYLKQPKNKKELKMLIDQRWDVYFSHCQDLARREGFHPGAGYDASLASVTSNPKTALEAKDYYSKFQNERVWLNNTYAAYLNAPYILKQNKEEHDRIIHNANAVVLAKQFVSQQTQDHYARLELMGMALSQSETAALEILESDLVEAKILLATETKRANELYADAFAEYTKLRPEHNNEVKVEVQNRREIILQGFEIYEGGYTRMGYPKTGTLRQQVPLTPPITGKEKRDLWDQFNTE